MRKINENKNDKKKNAVINKIYEEMQYAEEFIRNWNLSLTEEYSDVYSIDLYHLYKKDKQKFYELEKKYHHQYDLLDIYKYIKDSNKLDNNYPQPLKRITLYDEEGTDYQSEFHKVNWITTSSSKIKRIFSFTSNGDITYTKNKSKLQLVDYSAKYNVNSLDLNIFFNSANDKINVEFYNNTQYITYNNISIELNNIDGTKKISYNQNDSNNQTVSFEIIIDKSKKILNKYIIIKNYNQNNELESTYELYFNKDILTGALYFTKEHKKYNMLENEELTNLAKKISSSINKNNIVFNEDIDELEKLIINLKEQIYKLIKSIKNDIPLYGLEKRMEIALSNLFNKIKAPEEENKQQNNINKDKKINSKKDQNNKTKNNIDKKHHQNKDSKREQNNQKKSKNKTKTLKRTN